MVGAVEKREAGQGKEALGNWRGVALLQMDGKGRPCFDLSRDLKEMKK